MSRQVTQGKYTVKFPRRKKTSPGSLPSQGIFGMNRKRTPKAVRIKPKRIKIFPQFWNPNISLVRALRSCRELKSVNYTNP
jgi:hypothetical protein